MPPLTQKAPEEKYIALNREFLKPNSRINADIYILLGKRYTLYANKALHISIEHLNRLKNRLEKKVYIRETDYASLQLYFAENIAFMLNNERVPFEEKAELLFQTTYNLVKKIFEDAKNREVYQGLRSFVKETLPFLQSSKYAYINLIKLYKSEDYTYAHQVNVMAWLIVLALRLNITDSEQLTDIGVGGLLLDLGKCEIPQEILYKKSVLTHEENDLFRSHPKVGAELAKNGGMDSPIILDIISNHHENMDGRGYPRGISGPQLSIYAAMAQIVDTYDAITSDRPYSQAESKSIAVKYLLNRRDEYNSKVLLSFLELIGAEGA
jgi:HD-GYP domain-containing protein (c-di-GMP phosphodiesterase class II)